MSDSRANANLQLCIDASTVDTHSSINTRYASLRESIALILLDLER